MIDEIDLLLIYFKDYAHCFRPAGPKEPIYIWFFAANFYSHRVIIGIDFNKQRVCIWHSRFNNNISSFDCYAQVSFFNPNGPEIVSKKIDQIYNDAYFSSKKTLVRTKCLGHRH